MFGYIKPCRPELKIKELDAYKAVYCGLCGQLGKSYGPIARLTLSYDFTFLAMLAYGVTGETVSISMGRCYVNPLKRVPLCGKSDALALGADAAAIMLHYKLLDNVADSGFPAALGWRMLRPFTGRACRKAAATHPDIDRLVARTMEDQRELEQRREPSADAAGEPTAAALAGIFAGLSEKSGTRRVLERLGYLMGRFIYQCDALDDMEEDAAKGNYNPYLLRYGLKAESDSTLWEEARREAAFSLNMTIGEAEKTLALLPVKDFSPIIDNIITMGLRTSVNEILSKKEKCK